MRWTRLGLIVLTAKFASAQFASLATTDDGSEVYFVTSLRLQSDLSQYPPGSSAVYRINTAGIAERVSKPAMAPTIQNNVQVSGDGRVVSYSDFTPCFG